jgi:anti-sigma factor RsiW
MRKEEPGENGMVQEELLKKVHLFCDEEITADHMLEIETMIQRDPLLQREMAFVKKMKEKTRQVVLSENMTSSFEKQLRSSLKTASRARFNWRPLVAAALIFFILSLLSPFFKSGHSHDFLKLAGQHHREFSLQSSDHLEKNLTSTVHALNVDFKLNASEKNFSLPKSRYLGCCSCPLGEFHQARRLVYEIEGKRVSFYIVKSEKEISFQGAIKKLSRDRRSCEVGLCGSFNMVTWREGDFRFLLISELSQTRLLKLMDGIDY